MTLVTIAALLLENKQMSAGYTVFLQTPVKIRFGPWQLAKHLLLWINSGLMAIFFLLVGLEVKRELLKGTLSSWNQAALPVIAAIGGMLVPALIYVGFIFHEPASLRG